MTNKKVNILQAFSDRSPLPWFEKKYLSSTHEGVSTCVVGAPVWSNLAIQVHSVSPKVLVLHRGLSIPDLIPRIREMWPNLKVVYVLNDLNEVSLDPSIVMDHYIRFINIARVDKNFSIAVENPYTADEMSTDFGIRVLVLPTLCPITIDKPNRKIVDTNKILLCCRARPHLNVISLIRRCRRYAPDAVLHLLLIPTSNSYMRDYRQEIIDFALWYYPQNKVIIQEYRPRKEFLRFMATMDAVINVDPLGMITDVSREALGLEIPVYDLESGNQVHHTYEYFEQRCASMRSEFWSVLDEQVHDQEYEQSRVEDENGTSDETQKG